MKCASPGHVIQVWYLVLNRSVTYMCLELQPILYLTFLLLFLDISNWGPLLSEDGEQHNYYISWRAWRATRSIWQNRYVLNKGIIKMPLILQNCLEFVEEIFMDHLILTGLCFLSVLPIICKKKSVKRIFT